MGLNEERELMCYISGSAGQIQELLYVGLIPYSEDFYKNMTSEYGTDQMHYKYYSMCSQNASDSFNATTNYA